MPRRNHRLAVLIDDPVALDAEAPMLFDHALGTADGGKEEAKGENKPDLQVKSHM